jgi:hypothetical protein
MYSQNIYQQGFVSNNVRRGVPYNVTGRVVEDIDGVTEYMYSQLYNINSTQCENKKEYAKCVVDMSPIAAVKRAKLQIANNLKEGVMQPLKKAQKACQDVVKMAVDEFYMFGRFNFLQQSSYLSDYISKFSYLRPVAHMPQYAYAKLMATLNVYSWFPSNNQTCVTDISSPEVAVNLALENTVTVYGQEVEQQTNLIFDNLGTYLNARFNDEDDGNDEWHNAQNSQQWHNAQDNQNWLTTRDGQEWLTTRDGQEWLNTREGQEWLNRNQHYNGNGGSTLTRKEFFAWYIQCLIGNGSYKPIRSKKTCPNFTGRAPNNICETISANHTNFYGLYKEFSYYNLGEKIREDIKNKGKIKLQDKVDSIKQKLFAKKTQGIRYSRSCYESHTLIAKELHNISQSEIIMQKLASMLFNDVLLEAVFILYNNNTFFLSNIESEDKIVDYICFSKSMWNVLTNTNKITINNKTKTLNDVQKTYYKNDSQNTYYHVRHLLSVKLFQHLLMKELASIENALFFLDKIQEIVKELYKDHIWGTNLECRISDDIKDHLEPLVVLFGIFDDKRTVSQISHNEQPSRNKTHESDNENIEIQNDDIESAKVATAFADKFAKDLLEGGRKKKLPKTRKGKKTTSKRSKNLS